VKCISRVELFRVLSVEGRTGGCCKGYELETNGIRHSSVIKFQAILEVCEAEEKGVGHAS